MKPAGNKRGFALTLSRDYIRQTSRLSAEEKLNWLEEANEFINKTLSSNKRKTWMKYPR